LRQKAREPAWTQNIRTLSHRLTLRPSLLQQTFSPWPSRPFALSPDAPHRQPTLGPLGRSERFANRFSERLLDSFMLPRHAGDLVPAITRCM
jgi:hypothetical protein